jgi:hypothetical protein
MASLTRALAGKQIVSTAVRGGMKMVRNGVLLLALFFKKYNFILHHKFFPCYFQS